MLNYKEKSHISIWDAHKGRRFQLGAHPYSTNISIILQKRDRESERDMEEGKNTQIEKLKNDLKSTKETRMVPAYILCRKYVYIFVSLCRIHPHLRLILCFSYSSLLSWLWLLMPGRTPNLQFNFTFMIIYNNSGLDFVLFAFRFCLWVSILVWSPQRFSHSMCSANTIFFFFFLNYIRINFVLKRTSIRSCWTITCSTYNVYSIVLVVVADVYQIKSSDVIYRSWPRPKTQVFRKAL